MMRQGWEKMGHQLGANTVIHTAPCKLSGHPILQKRKQTPGERVMHPKSQQLRKCRGQDESQLRLNAKLPSSGCSQGLGPLPLLLSTEQATSFPLHMSVC